MPIIKDGNGVIQYTPRSAKYDEGVEGGCGVEVDRTFAIADEVDVLKQVQFDPTPQGTNSTVIFRSGNTANNGTVVLTLPATSTTLGGSGTTVLADSHIFVGNASNMAADVAMSGDISITNAGVTSISAGSVVNADISSSASIALTKLATLTPGFALESASSGGVDSFTSLMLHLDGATIDSSQYSNTVLTDDTAAYITGKFSNAFDFSAGAQNRLRVNSGLSGGIFDFASGNFTIDLWVRRTVSSADEVLVCRAGTPAGSPDWTLRIVGAGPNDTKLRFLWNDDANSITGGAITADGLFHHVEVCRSGSVITMYLDGASIASGAISGAINFTPASDVSVGAFYDTYTWQSSSYIDELRISKGIARNTAAFTPPTSAYTTVAGGNIEVSTVTNAELSYVSGVTSAIQTQLNTKLSATTYSNSLGNTSSEYFGSGATGSGIQQTVMGNAANASSGTNNTIFGRSSTGSAAGNDVIIGQFSSAGVGGSATGIGNNVSVSTGGSAFGAGADAGLNSVCMGSGALCADDVTGRNIAIGRTATIAGTSANCLAIGTNAVIPTGLANIAIIGSDQTPYTDIYIGQGYTSTAASNTALIVTPRTGSNAAGSNLTIKAGNGTGLGGSGEIFIQTAPVAGSSSTPNTLATVGRIGTDGKWTIGAASTTPTHAINGAVNTAGASLGTLTNAPSAGNPAGYLTVTINGATRYIPFWA